MSTFSRDKMATLNQNKNVLSKWVVIAQKQTLHNHLPKNQSQKKQNTSGWILSTFAFIFEYGKHSWKKTVKWSQKQSLMLEVVAVSHIFLKKKTTKSDLYFYIVIQPLLFWISMTMHGPKLSNKTDDEFFSWVGFGNAVKSPYSVYPL